MSFFHHYLDDPHLPCLVVDSKETIFIPNAAIWWLVPPKDEHKGKVREILELEATVLSPFLALLLGNNLKCEKIKKSVLSAIDYFNASLGGVEFLVGVSAFHISTLDPKFPVIHLDSDIVMLDDAMCDNISPFIKPCALSLSANWLYLNL